MQAQSSKLDEKKELSDPDWGCRVSLWGWVIQKDRQGVPGDISIDLPIARLGARRKSIVNKPIRLFEQGNECIQNEHCRPQLSDVFEEQIPSGLTNEGLSFKYYGSGEACEG